MNCNLTVKDILDILQESLDSGEIAMDSNVYVSDGPCSENNDCLNVKAICSACSCKTKKNLVLLIK